jgi:hypothetical protein
MLFNSHTLVLTNIQQVAPNQYTCYFQSGIYLVFIGFYSSIINGIVISLLLGILGLVALKNIQNLRRVGVPRAVLVNGILVANRPSSINSKNRQFILMLLMDIATYIILSSMLFICILYQQIIQSQTKNIGQIQFELFVREVAALVA